LRYSAFGLGLETTHPISRLDGAPAAQSIDLFVNVGRAPDWEAAVEAAELCYESAFRDDGGRPLLSIDRLQNDWLRLIYAEGTRFWLHPLGQELFVTWPKPYSLDDISSYLLGPVMALVLRLRGQICLHASAVVMGSTAIAFAGDAGSGKSTTAAACAARGHALLADDVMPLVERQGRLFAAPAYPRLRLWPASIDALREAFNIAIETTVDPRRRHHLDLRGPGLAFRDADAALGRIFVLGERQPPGAPATIEPLSGHEAAIALLAHSYSSRLWNTPGERVRELTVLTRLADAVPVRVLRPPQDLARMADLVRAIEDAE
jgi:hypothetical protein